MNLFKLMLLTAVILCFGLSFSFAEDLTRTGPCQADIQKFCKNVKPGRGRLLLCMRQYNQHLSNACVDHIGVVREKTKQFAKACKNDTRQFCGNLKAGQGAVYRCLKQHQESLSAVCANQVK